MSEDPTLAPGTLGEQAMQAELGTAHRALAFHSHQILDHLNVRMREYVARQEFLVIATSNAAGDCDSSLRTGPPGFVHILGPGQLLYPDFRGNGVMASLGNLVENPRIGMLFLDMLQTRVGLHVNGAARVLTVNELASTLDAVPNGPELADSLLNGQRDSRTMCWVLVEVHEAYIHCSKHIPHLQRAEGAELRPVSSKSGDYFFAKRSLRPLKHI